MQSMHLKFSRQRQRQETHYNGEDNAGENKSYIHITMELTTRATGDEGVSFAIVFHKKTKEYHRDNATTMLLSDYHLLLCGFDVADGYDMVGAYDHRVLYV